MITATSFIIGAAIKNEKVIPRGIPVSTNPKNKGIAEQEQKGVRIPRNEAMTFPANKDFPSNAFRVFSGEKYDRIIPDTKITKIRRRNIFWSVLRKNQIVEERLDS